MSGAQIAHLLKQIGHGNEMNGIRTVYCLGWRDGALQVLLGIGVVGGLYLLSQWEYGKLMHYLQEDGYLCPPSEC